MDLSSLTGGRSGLAPDAYADPDVETRIAFDTNNRPYYVAVQPSAPVEPYRAPYAPAAGPPVVYQPVQPYYVPPASAPYSPLRDPWVVRLVAGGFAVAGAGVALSFMLAALAAAETALALLLGVMVVGWLMTASNRSRTDRSVNVRITNTNRSRYRH